MLKEYLIRGYAINEQKLREQAERFAELRQTVNVRAMSEKLRVPLIAPVSRFQGGAGSPEQKDDIRPTDLSPIITHHRPREIKFLRWGLISPFVNQKEVKPMFSARAETLTKLASFRDLIMVSCCLIINAGFFETEKTSDEQIQHQISPAQKDYFYKAGLWTTARDQNTGNIKESFTMITCDHMGHSFSKPHGRMPIIMNQTERRLWMNPNAPQDLWDL